ncbi:MAG: DUF2065 domain-containing protein [Rhizobiales bacterium]|nr:DUF2065 domain-containing protein [Hyphomicrobiales bacterium]
MIELATALGLVLVIEGLLYATAPAKLKQLMLQMQAIPDDALRVGGVAAIGIGVVIVWLVRTVFGSS